MIPACGLIGKEGSANAGQSPWRTESGPAARRPPGASRVLGGYLPDTALASLPVAGTPSAADIEPDNDVPIKPPASPMRIVPRL